MTFVLTAGIPVNDAPIEELEAAFGKLLEVSRAFEGNLGVDVIVDQTDPSVWLLVEKWESEDAQAAYVAYRTGLVGAVDPLADFRNGPTVIGRYDVRAAI